MPLSARDATYQIDDGIAEATLVETARLTSGGMNAFTVVPGAETLDSLSVQFPSALPTTYATRMYVLRDPNNDGDPRDVRACDLLWSGSVTPPGAPAWVERSIPPTYVGPAGTGFFVMVLVDATPGTRVLQLDRSPGGPVGWIFEAPPGFAVTYPLGTNAYLGPTSVFGAAYKFLLRAHGVAAPCGPVWQNCPASQIIDNDPGVCGAIANFVPPTLDQSFCTDDLVGPPIVTGLPASGQPFPLGTTTVSYTVVTVNGIAATCCTEVTVRDTQPPVVDCPPEFWRVQCNDPIGYIYRPFNYGGYVENCPAPTFYGHDYPFGISGPWDIWAVDQSGNESNHCEFMIEVVGDMPGPARPQSDARLDGAVLESRAASGVGGSFSSTTYGAAVGDDSSNRQSKAIFSFDLTGTPVPPDAIITRAYVRLTQTGSAGIPSSLGALTADHSSTFFGATSSLAAADFEATSNGVTPDMVTFALPPSNGASTIGDIDPSNFSRLSRAGMNQFRVHFATPWARTNVQDSITFATGESPNAPQVRPELVVEYYLQACNPCNLPGTGGPSNASVGFSSTAASDGYVKESHWTSGVGGSPIATGTFFDVGDTSAREQLLGVLSFDTSSIPANAKITSAQLQLTRLGATGNPGSMGSLVADMKCGGVFGTTALEAADFQAYAQFQQVATFPTPTTNNQNVTGFLSWDGMNAIQKGAGATTQFKIRFTNTDNGNAIADYLMLGTAEGSGAQPRLLVTYEY